MGETVVMAANRYRLENLAGKGQVGACLAHELLARTDGRSGVVLLDIIEDLNDRCATTVPGCEGKLAWHSDDRILVEGSHSLRELSKELEWTSPIKPPRPGMA